MPIRSSSPSISATTVLYRDVRESTPPSLPLLSPYNRNPSQRSSPLKRERSSPPPSDDDSPPDRKKHVTVQSNAIVSHLPSFSSRHERRQKALEIAQARDMAWRLPESGTMVQLEPNEFPSSPERYVHTNDYQWENDTLSKCSIDNQIQTAFRVFLECFYGICGFVPYWDRDEESRVTVSTALTSQNNRKMAVEEYWAKCLKSDLGIYKKDLKFLEGKQSGYKDSHQYVHSMSVAAVAAGMSKYERVFLLGERRSRIYQRIWEHMTGHQEYKDGMEDTRLMTSKGIGAFQEDNIYGDNLSSEEDVEETV